MAHLNTTKLFKGDTWAPLLDASGNSVHGCGRTIWVRQDQQNTFTRIANAAKANYGQLYIHGQIVSLRNMGFFKSLFSRACFSDRQLPLEGGALVYEVSGGDIYLKDIVVDTQSGYDIKAAKAGVYRIDNQRGSWQVKGDEEEKAYAENGAKTKHIAVNGLCDSIKDAAAYMPAFITYAYGETALKGGVYNLFYNPSNHFGGSDWRAISDSITFAGKGTQAARKLAALIVKLSKSEKDHCWTVHERGHALFKRALALALKTGAESMQKHQVFYANPTENITLVDNYRKKAGMQLAPKPMLINDMSLHQAWLTGNVLTDYMVSMRHLAEQGASADFKRTKADIGISLVKRLTLAGSFSLPGLVGAPAWGAGILALALSQCSSQNKKVITGWEDILRNTFS